MIKIKKKKPSLSEKSRGGWGNREERRTHVKYMEKKAKDEQK